MTFSFRKGHSLVLGILFLSLFSHAVNAADNAVPIFWAFEADQFEHRNQDGRDIFVWEAQGWIGTDRNKLSLKTQGEVPYGKNPESAEVQFLYKRMISRFFDAQLGIRHDIYPNPDRTYLALGVQGLAPQWFEIDGTIFVSHKGKASLRFEAEYDVLLTQKLILSPNLELNVAFEDDKAIDLGSGLAKMEMGLRLRYHINRDIAPYIGVNWDRKFGETADLARAEHEDASEVSLVIGLRLSF